jgi:hypothetical protein
MQVLDTRIRCTRLVKVPCKSARLLRAHNGRGRKTATAALREAGGRLIRCSPKGLINSRTGSKGILHAVWRTGKETAKYAISTGGDPVYYCTLKRKYICFRAGLYPFV